MIRFVPVALKEKSVIPIRSEIVYLGIDNDGIQFPFGPIVAATVLILVDGSALLQHLLVSDESRGKGLGMEALRFIHRKHGPIHAQWTTKGGCALARKFDAEAGAQPWQIGCQPLPPELEGIAVDHPSDADLEYAS